MSDKKNNSERPILEKRIGQFSERLKLVMNNESVLSFSQKVGVSEGTIRNLLKNGLPRLDNLVAIAEAGNVNIEWLATGEGKPNKDLLAKNNEMDEFALIPGYNIQISAGNGSQGEQEQVTRKLAFRHKWLKFKGLKEKDLVLVFTKGDSMEPTISDNNTLMIDTSQQQLVDGSIYVIRNNEHLVVKRIQNTLKGFYLISDNKEYEKVEVTYNEADDLKIIGRVVWVGKDL